jgi:hypothetical protein
MKYLAIPELEKFEAEKRQRLAEIETGCAALAAKRPALLLAMGEGDSEAERELQGIDADAGKLKLEAESLRAVLATIPARKAYARGVELEAALPGFDRAEAELQPLIDRVLKAAEKLHAEGEKLLEGLASFDAVNQGIPVEKGSNQKGAGAALAELFGLGAALNLKQSLLNVGADWIINLAPIMAPGINGGQKPFPTAEALLLMTGDPSKLTKWLDIVRKDIEKRREDLKQRARKLKGEGPTGN